MTPARAIQLDVVVPVRNEEAALEASVRELHANLTTLMREPWRITIADNGSTDSTALVAHRLALELPEVSVLLVTEPGRGRALKTAWPTWTPTSRRTCARSPRSSPRWSRATRTSPSAPA